MNSIEYDCAMKRKFNVVMACVLLPYLGVMMATVSSPRFGVDPMLTFAVATVLSFAIVLGAVVWRHYFVASELRRIEDDEEADRD